MEWLVERSPYWDILGGLEDREEGGVGPDAEDLDLVEG